MRRRVLVLAGLGMAAVLAMSAAPAASSTPPPIPGNFRISSGATADETLPALAWNGTADEYLVVWIDGRNVPPGSPDAEIYGRRLSATGVPLGEEIRIGTSDTASIEHAPAVVWNATANQYLVVWEDRRDYPNRCTDIYGRRLSAAGRPLGAKFRISDFGATTCERDPSLAWNATVNQYLVVWEDTRNRDRRGVDIYGQRLTVSGGRIGANFRVSDAAATRSEHYPAAAWSATADEYLIIWSDERRPNEESMTLDIFGHRLGATGSAVGSVLRITGPGRAGAWEHDLVIVWNAADNEYLVAWVVGGGPARGFDVYGQRLSAAGDRLEEAFRISGPRAIGYEWCPAVAWNSAANQYLVVWEDERDQATRGADIYRQRISATGALVGGNARVSGPAATGDEFCPAVAWNSTDRQYLVAWQDGRDRATRGWDIYGQRLTE